MNDKISHKIIENLFKKNPKIIDITNSKDPLESYKIGSKTIGQILKDFNNNEISTENTIREAEDSLNVYEDLELKGIIFLNQLEVSYYTLKDVQCQIIVDKNVRSTLQIDEKIKELGAKKAFFNIDEKFFPYFQNKKMLVNAENIIIYLAINPYKLCNNNMSCLTKSKKKLSKETLSLYFDIYFKYRLLDKEGKFIYYESKQRKDLNDKFEKLIDNDDLNKFKITGPSNDGKSTTLLYLSRLYLNIIYLNLKVLDNLYIDNDINTILAILTYEFGRLHFRDEETKNCFEQIFFDYIDESPWMIIIKLIDYIIDIKMKVVIILDQFKSSSSFSIIYEKIESKLNKLLKVVVSFSISDNKDFNNIANSLVKNKGNPTDLTKESQKDYFYYSNLLNKEEVKKLKKEENKENPAYNLFNYNPKYIDLLELYKFDFIKIQIINYLEEHSKKIGINNFPIYLYNYSKSIEKDFPFEDLYAITNKIPMKYNNLEIKGDKFQIKYQFDYLRIIIKNYLELDRIKEYFINNRDKDDYFEKKLKGEYFEALACDILYEKQNIFFNNEIKGVLTVNDIISMEKYDKNDYDEIKIENYNNLNSEEKKITKTNDYYDQTLKILNEELENLKSLRDKDDDNIDDIISFKYEVYSQEKDYLNKKRKRNLIETNEKDENDEEINEPKGEKEGDKDGKKEQKSKNPKKNKLIKKKCDDSEDLEKDIEIYDYKLEFREGGILIKQKNVCGKTLDLAVLLGPADQKIFIGFQMKYYEKGTHLKDPSILEKKYIKNSIKPILINCLKDFNIKIVEWHYIFCIYYNSKTGDYNTTLKNNCNQYDIEYILFDPYKEKFYNRNFIPIESKIELNYRSNLDCLSSNNPYIIFKNVGCSEYFSKQRIISKDKKDNNIKIFDLTKEEIIRGLNKILSKQFEFIEIFQYILKFPFPTPEKNYLLLFKGMNKNNYIYYYNNNDEYLCGDLYNTKTFNAGIISEFVEHENEIIQFYVFLNKN